MPLELGIFLGAKRFGKGRDEGKLCLILDRQGDRYQKYCSDIAGQDICAHQNRVEGAVKGVRNWLSSQLTGRNIQVPGGTTIVNRFLRFRGQVPALCMALQLDSRELLFNEYTNLVTSWLGANPW
jgi:hypothetical protein